MKLQRRALLKSLLTAAAVLAVPRWLFAARPDAAFDAEGADAAISDIFDGPITESDQIKLKIPDIAENGAVVPVTVSTDLADVQAIGVVVVNNPTPLAALFELSPQSVAEVSVRIKMGESSEVKAIVKAGGKLYSASKEVKVTIGGCGG
jgi:sulfur-oxidizing protein SoxY